MKKIYVQPEITTLNIDFENLMESFSLPTVGNMNDPSPAQSKESYFNCDDEEQINSDIWD